MSALAPILEAFFTDRLVQQRHASPHTIAAPWIYSLTRLSIAPLLIHKSSAENPAADIVTIPRQIGHFPLLATPRVVCGCWRGGEIPNPDFCHRLLRLCRGGSCFPPTAQGERFLGVRRVLGADAVTDQDLDAAPDG